ncbi:MAG: type 1 glutamine amidotransferase [Betaproteobacteria bacterium]|nr:type 1 glutamine amidotransferase [Betaproteobacteria bacterium]
MKPIAIFRFSPTEGAGHFATFLDSVGIPWQLVALDKRESVPLDLSPWSGFGFMGGPMSANDELPWTQPVLTLIREAVRANQPCIGHCLGGQLMARALGGAVTVNPVKEIGWHRVEVEQNPIATEWLGAVRGFHAFQWHGDTFSTLPPGATRILSGPHCANQAYVLGPHLGMQCHVEMTEAMIDNWCEDGAVEIETALGEGQIATVMTPANIRNEVERALPGLRSMAERLYRRWITGLIA